MNGSSPWRIMWRLVRNQPVRYAVSLLTWIVIWSWPVLLGLIAQAFFDRLTGDGGWSIGVLVAATVGHVLAYLGLIWVGIRLHASLMVRARTSVQRAMLAWILRLPAARPVSETPGEVVSRFRDDTEHLQEAFDFSVDFAGASISAGIGVAVLASVAPLLTVAVVVPLGLTVLAVWALGGRIARYRVAARGATEAVTGFMGETFTAVGAVKVAGAEPAVLSRMATVNDHRRAMMVRDRTLTAATDAMVDNAANVALGLVLVLAVGTISIGGAEGLSVGDVALFTLLLWRIAHGAQMSGRFLARLRQAGVSVDRMLALMPGATPADLFTHHPLEDEVAVPAAPARVAAARVASSGVASTRPAAAPVATVCDSADPAPEQPPLLELVGVSTRHPDGTPGVVDVDLAVPAGALVVVTGRVGSGKTTLLRAAVGLVPTSGGEIRWRGEPITDPAVELLPPRVAYTPQVPQLFAMDLRDNLLLGVADADVAQALRAAVLEEDLASMPKGLDTTIGPRGLRLSGGQVQRTAAARMLLRRPELLLVDDVSSALDTETEATLWDRLFEEEGTTALVVSHRRPALVRADLVVVLDEGRVVATGTAEELRDRSPIFRELWG